LKFDTELRAASAYVTHTLPDTKNLKAIRKAQSEVAAKLANIRAYIDSEVALTTELVGQTPPASGETGTISVLIKDYTEAYATVHDSVMAQLEEHRAKIEALPVSEEFKALQTLEGISALRPPVSGSLNFQSRADQIRLCPSPSRQSVEQQLRNGPVHECCLTFETCNQQVQHAEQVSQQAEAELGATLDRKVEVFLNPAIRSRLDQGKEEKLIADLLGKTTLPEVRGFLVENASPELVETINRYLKNIVTKNVKLTDFKPSLTTIEPDQASKMVKEFEEFLDDQFKAASGGDEGTLPMLHIE
jgi:hypothetical protein